MKKIKILSVGILLLSLVVSEAVFCSGTVPGTMRTVKAAEEEETDKSGNVYVEAKADGTTKEITLSEGLEGLREAETLPVSVKVSYYLDDQKMKPEEMAGVSGRVKIRFDYENLTYETVETDGKKVETAVPFLAVSAVILPTEQFSNIEISEGKVIAGEDQNIAAGIAFPGFKDSLKLQSYEATKDVEIPDYVEITADATDFELDLTATVITPCGFGDMDLDDLDDVDELVNGMKELTDASSQLADGIGTLSDGMNEFQSYLTAYTDGVDQVNEGAKALADGLAVMDTSRESLVSGALALQAGLDNLKSALEQIRIPSGDGEGIKAASDTAAVLWQDAEALEDTLDAMRNQFATACDELEAADLSGIAQQIDAEATRQAQEQAKAQIGAYVEEALDGAAIEGLTPEQKAQIIEAVNGISFERIQITGTTAGVQQQIEAAQQALQNAADAVDVKTITGVLDDMQMQAETLKGYAEEIQGISAQVEMLRLALGELEEGAAQLESGSSRLVEGIDAFGGGIGEVSKGASALQNGTSALTIAGGQLDEGFTALTEGASILKEAMQTFDRDGIQELSKLAGNDLENVIIRVKAMKEAENRYKEKIGLEERGIESIQFILETEEISK